MSGIYLTIIADGPLWGISTLFNIPAHLVKLELFDVRWRYVGIINEWCLPLVDKLRCTMPAGYHVYVFLKEWAQLVQCVRQLSLVFLSFDPSYPSPL